jgi:UDP-glucose 4-epimerase
MPLNNAPRRPILILGGTGFLGSHLVASLSNGGEDACVISTPTTPDAKAGLGLQIAAAIRHNRPSTIFHLIGSGTPALRANPDYHLTKNVGAARVVTAALRAADFDGTLVFTSTGAVYGNTPVAASESVRPRPLTGHARSKLEAEHVLGEAAPRVVVARLFQVYGEGHRKLVVHDLARRICLEDGPLRLRSTGAETRDLAFVDDVVAALRALANSRSPTCGSEIYNVASGVGVRIDALARRLLFLAGQEHREVVPAHQAEENPLMASVGDPTKLVQLGIAIPQASDETLLRALDWTAAHAD